MDLQLQREKAAQFRAMHRGSCILVLPNAYDAISAMVFEAAGFKAIATASAGIAFSLGYPDGEVMPRGEMLDAVARIVRAVSVPVSADMESGYADSAQGVADTVRAVIGVGAIGVNLEDAIHTKSGQIYDLPVAAERIQVAREAADAAGVPIVINARTDVFIRRVGEEHTRFNNAVARANAYHEAGADCVYVMGVRDRSLIAELVKAIHAPLNIIGGPGVPSAPELQQMGVARVSVGPGPALAAIAATRLVAKELFEKGTYTSFSSVPTYVEINALLDRRPSR